jgi:hypothetical protein
VGRKFFLGAALRAGNRQVAVLLFTKGGTIMATQEKALDQTLQAIQEDREWSAERALVVCRMNLKYLQHRIGLADAKLGTVIPRRR